MYRKSIRTVDYNKNQEKMAFQLVSGVSGFGDESIAVHFVDVHLNRNYKSSEINDACDHYPKKYL